MLDDPWESGRADRGGRCLVFCGLSSARLGVSVLVLLPAVTVLLVLHVLEVRRNVNADCCCKGALRFVCPFAPSIVLLLREFFEPAEDPLLLLDLLSLLLLEPIEPVSSDDEAVGFWKAR